MRLGWVKEKAYTYLDRLPMILENVHPHDSLVEIRIRALLDIVIQMLLVPEGIHSFEDEVEQCLQILRTRACDKDIRISMGKRRRDSQAEGSRLSSSTTGC